MAINNTNAKWETLDREVEIVRLEMVRNSLIGMRRELCSEEGVGTLSNMIIEIQTLINKLEEGEE